MKDRIKTLRKSTGLNQTDFGARVGVKGNTIGNYEIGLRNPSDAVVFSICREFNVSENWLRHGEGEMLEDLSEDEEMMVLIGKLCADGNAFKRRVLMAAAKIIDNDDVWYIIEKELKKLINKKEE